MDFYSAEHKQSYERTQGMLRELFGEMAEPDPQGPSFRIVSGSALVRVIVNPINETNSAISVMSWVVTGAETTPELTRYLLGENYKIRFGAFQMDEVGDIAFEHAVHAGTCSKEQLRYSVMSVAKIADDYDDAIRSKFGGLRAADR